MYFKLLSNFCGFSELLDVSFVSFIFYTPSQVSA